MKNLLLVLAFILGGVGISQAQDYNSAIGLRLGYPLAVTYKMFLNEASALEGYVGFRNRFGYNEFRVNAAYLIHNELESVERLKWYYGGGAGLVFYSFDGTGEGDMSIALNGYLGLEYTLEDTPISFSIDWVPTYQLNGFIDGFRGGYMGLAARYVIE